MLAGVRRGPSRTDQPGLEPDPRFAHPHPSRPGTGHRAHPAAPGRAGSPPAIPRRCRPPAASGSRPGWSSWPRGSPDGWQRPSLRPWVSRPSSSPGPTQPHKCCRSWPSSWRRCAVNAARSPPRSKNWWMRTLFSKVLISMPGVGSGPPRSSWSKSAARTSPPPGTCRLRRAGPSHPPIGHLDPIDTDAIVDSLGLSGRTAHPRAMGVVGLAATPRGSSDRSTWGVGKEAVIDRQVACD